MQHFSPPGNAFAKLNVERALCKKAGKYDVGVVVRVKGCFMVAVAVPFEGLWQPRAVETQAFLVVLMSKLSITNLKVMKRSSVLEY